MRYKIRMRDLFPGIKLRAKESEYTRPPYRGHPSLVAGKLYEVVRQGRDWYLVNEYRNYHYMFAADINRQFDMEGPW